MDLLVPMGTFVRIADAGSISRAARSLRLSVPMASRHLKALEQHLGVVLVRRTTRHLTLTQEGLTFLPRARSILASVQSAREELHPGSAPSGTLVLSLPVSFGLAQVAPLFPAFLRRNAKVRLDLRFEDRLSDLSSEGVDLAVRAGVAPPDSPFLVARRLATTERVLCATPAFLRAAPKLDSAEGLTTVPCVLQGDALARWQLGTPEGPRVVEVDGRVRTNNVVAARDAVLAGLGVGRLPRWIVDEDLRERRLLQVLPELGLPRIEIFAVYLRNTGRPALVHAMVAHLRKELPRRTCMERVGQEPPRRDPEEAP